MQLPPITNIEYPTMCIRCNSDRIIKNGHRNGKQRYWCNSCRRSFGYHAQNQYYPHVRKHQHYLRYLALCRKPLTVRACANLVGVSPATIYRWRRIYLQVLSNTSVKRITPTPQAGIASTPIYCECLPSLVQRLRQPHPLGWRSNQCVRLPETPDRRFDILHIYIAHITMEANQYSFIVPRWNEPVANDFWTKWGVNEPKNWHRGKHTSLTKLISLLFVHWLKSFRGIHVKYLHLYLSWFNECWRDITKAYGFKMTLLLSKQKPHHMRQCKNEKVTLHHARPLHAGCLAYPSKENTNTGGAPHEQRD